MLFQICASGVNVNNILYNFFSFSLSPFCQNVIYEVVLSVFFFFFWNVQKDDKITARTDYCLQCGLKESGQASHH